MNALYIGNAGFAALLHCPEPLCRLQSCLFFPALLRQDLQSSSPVASPTFFSELISLNCVRICFTRHRHHRPDIYSDDSDFYREAGPAPSASRPSASIIPAGLFPMMHFPSCTARTRPPQLRRRTQDGCRRTRRRPPEARFRRLAGHRLVRLSAAGRYEPARNFGSSRPRTGCTTRLQRIPGRRLRRQHLVPPARQTARPAHEHSPAPKKGAMKTAPGNSCVSGTATRPIAASTSATPAQRLSASASLSFKWNKIAAQTAC